MIYNINPSQLKVVITEICEKTKLVFATKSNLKEEVTTLNNTISALEARIEALENKEETVSDQIDSEEP